MSVVLAALVAALVCLAVGGVAVASAAQAGRGAAQAADFAALAGALALRDSGDPARACRVAATIAEANGASVWACSATDGMAVTVRCATRSRWSLPGVGRIAERTARAGPADSAGPAG